MVSVMFQHVSRRRMYVYRLHNHVILHVHIYIYTHTSFFEGAFVQVCTKCLSMSHRLVFDPFPAFARSGQTSSPSTQRLDGPKLGWFDCFGEAHRLETIKLLLSQCNCAVHVITISYFKYVQIASWLIHPPSHGSHLVSAIKPGDWNQKPILLPRPHHVPDVLIHSHSVIKRLSGKRPQTVCGGGQKETRLVVVMMMTMTHRWEHTDEQKYETT